MNQCKHYSCHRAAQAFLDIISQRPRLKETHISKRSGLSSLSLPFLYGPGRVPCISAKVCRGSGCVAAHVWTPRSMHVCFPSIPRQGEEEKQQTNKNKDHCRTNKSRFSLPCQSSRSQVPRPRDECCLTSARGDPPSSIKKSQRSPANWDISARGPDALSQACWRSRRQPRTRRSTTVVGVVLTVLQTVSVANASPQDKVDSSLHGMACQKRQTGNSHNRTSWAFSMSERSADVHSRPAVST